MFKEILKKSFRKLGYNISAVSKDTGQIIYPADFEDLHKKVIEEVKNFTMTSPERLYGLIEGIKYITKKAIPGDIVECGVWKGGSMMAVAKTLQSVNDAERNLYLFDTFDGMSEPSAKDIDNTGNTAKQLMETREKTEEDVIWATSPLDKVKQNLFSTNYPKDKILFIQGMVEQTLPYDSIKSIALLRLDTDWYESTKHEMETLFPLLQKGGVLIIDDYGHWKGAREAIDEYLAKHNITLLLNRLDYTGRIGIKQ